MRLKVKTLVLVDGNYCLVRAACSRTGLKTTNGECTDGIHVFLRHLWASCHDKSQIVVVFDKGHNEKRLSIYPDYKKRTPKEKELTEVELMMQEAKILGFEYMPTILSALGIPVISIDGHEADDIIYFLAKYLKDKFSVSIVSEDSDYIQMLKHGVDLIRPMKGDVVTPNNYEDLFPFPVEYFTLFKSLVGDNSDNIPGVPKIGKVTAGKIIQFIIDNNFDNVLVGLLEWASLADKAVNKSLKENMMIVKRNMRLVDIENMSEFSDLYIETYNKEVNSAKKNYEKVKELFNRFELYSHNNWLYYAKHSN